MILTTKKPLVTTCNRLYGSLGETGWNRFGFEIVNATVTAWDIFSDHLVGHW